MRVKQISVFVENKSGRLAAITRALADVGINVRAMSIADTADFGILRLIVDDPVKAHGVLKEQGFAVRITEVLALRVPDEPGGLAGVLEAIEGQKLNVEYMYAFVEKAENDALVIVRIENVEQAIPALQELGVGLIDEDDLYNL